MDRGKNNAEFEREISRGIVAIYKEYLGRGPTVASTTITPYAAVTTVGDALTKAERTLVEKGDTSIVREMRRKFQDAMRRDITALVENVTGRKAETFLSDHHTEDDIAMEVVVFAPEERAAT